MVEACARAPVGLLAELTHRCPLQCPYCSNPLELERVNTELTTAEWQDVMRQAAELGILQIHLSGGEPTVTQGSRRHRRGCGQGRPLHQPDHGGRDADPRPPEDAEGPWPRSRPAIDSGRRRSQRREDLRLQGRPRQEARSSASGCANSICRSPSTRRSTATTSKTCRTSSTSPSRWAPDASRSQTSSITPGR